MAIINPKPKSFKELIHDKYYQVPLYQRPYDWEIDQVSELWNDIDKNEPGYFLGTILLKPEKPVEQYHSYFEIVDGQQRLATLLLLIRAAIETLDQAGDKKLANEFQRDYIEQKPAGVEAGKLTVVLSKRDKDKFESLLLGQTYTGGRSFSSWKNMEKTSQFFRDKFQSLHQSKGRDGIVKFLNDKILKLSFLDIELGTDGDVYQFFETLNDRGMDLSIADLVKNRVCAESVKQNRPVEDSVSTIDDLSETLGPGKFKTFLLHYCWANDEKEEPTPRKKLMDWYGERINRSSDIRKFLAHLEEYAARYVNFVRPNNCNDKDKKELFGSLESLGATRCYPLLLTGEKFLIKKNFLKLCKAVEILIFRHSTILKRDAKVLEGVFYDLAGDIRKKKDIDDILTIFKKQDAMKSDAQFELAFSEFSALDHKTARYVLWKVEESISGKKQAPLDWSRLTLEHILAEKLNWAGREEYLERLGNLTLLSAPMNSDAANKPFIKKRNQDYKKEKRIKITQSLIKYSNFDKDSIILRQKELASRAVKIWSSNNIK